MRRYGVDFFMLPAAPSKLFDYTPANVTGTDHQQIHFAPVF